MSLEAGLFAALVLLVTGIWLAFRAQRWLARRSRQRRAARAQRAEHDAAGLLEACGFEVLGRQVRQGWALTVDGRDLSVSLVADYVVERDGQRWVAEVKTGERSLDLRHGPTRRQLLEYCHAFGVEGMLLVDAEAQTLRDVRFQGTRPPAGSRGSRTLLAGVIAGWALALAAWLALESEPSGAARGARSDIAHVGEVTSGDPSSPAPRESSTVASSAGAKGTTVAERLRGKLAEVMRESRDLEAQLRTVEGELARSAEVPPTGDPRDFDLDREDWKALAAEGRIKYRIPCALPTDGAYATPPADLDALGLSPKEGQLLNEAHRRSNARVWGVVRPLCLQLVGKSDVVDLLGVQSCLQLLDRAAVRADFMAAADARRRVAEVHAGVTPPPTDGEPQSSLFTALMAVTSEAQRFRSDLAESFGPEEANRIADSMRCVATVR